MDLANGIRSYECKLRERERERERERGQCKVKSKVYLAHKIVGNTNEQRYTFTIYCMLFRYWYYYPSSHK